MSIKACVWRRLFPRQEFDVEVVDEVDEEPLGLQHGVALAGTQGAERDQRVPQLLPVLVELGVNKPVVLEDLSEKKNNTI